MPRWYAALTGANPLRRLGDGIPGYFDAMARYRTNRNEWRLSVKIAGDAKSGRCTAHLSYLLDQVDRARMSFSSVCSCCCGTLVRSDVISSTPTCAIGPLLILARMSFVPGLL
jgi:hypothetical protein